MRADITRKLNILQVPFRLWGLLFQILSNIGNKIFRNKKRIMFLLYVTRYNTIKFESFGKSCPQKLFLLLPFDSQPIITSPVEYSGMWQKPDGEIQYKVGKQDLYPSFFHTIYQIQRSLQQLGTWGRWESSKL